MRTVNIFLNFKGNCEEAFNFYKSVFGGEFTYLGKFKDMPQDENCSPMSEEDGRKVMHVSLPISKETCLMGSDVIGEYVSHFNQGNNFSITIKPESKDEADKLYKALSIDGKILMPMADAFWGGYFGMLIDKFGINWIVDFEKS